jgi:serine/threonine-protein kinase
MGYSVDPARDLLVGLLALQNGLVDQAALVAAVHAWTRDKGCSLSDHLIALGYLEAAHRPLLDGLAAAHLARHGGDAEKSLAALHINRFTRESLAAAGPDIVASLARGSSGATEHHVEADPELTASYVVGSATSDGQRFWVLRPHARGGLGAVFVALDSELHREVALKQILDEHADDLFNRRRFLLEAEITGGLEHPGIVPVYGLGAYRDGRPYYAMRFIRGESLKEAIEHFHSDLALQSDAGRRSLELRKLLRRFIDVCYTIEYAHSRGVLHRDIKPTNVIVGKHGETLVVDWGLAKPTGRPESSPGSEERTLVPSTAVSGSETLPGSVLGTPAYMSPEQAAGDLERVDARSDVYSLGASLYCMLTGSAPFAGDPVDVIPAVQKGGFRPPRQVIPSIEPALEAICLKAMAKMPADRYSAPREVAEDVERWMADEPVSAWRESWASQARRWMRRRRTAMTAAAVLLVATVIALSIGTITLGRAEERTRKQRDEAQKQRALAEENFRLARQAVDEYFTQVSENTLLDSPVPGVQPLRKELLQTALRYYREFQARHRDESGLRAELARACYRIGRITVDVGTTEEALAAYDEARTLGEALVRERPDDAVICFDLARSARGAGSLLRGRMGRRAEGLERLQRARELCESLLRDRPDDPEFQTELAECYADIGHAHFSGRLSTPPLQFLEKAMAIVARLARVEPSYGHRYSEARIRHLVAYHYERSGDAREALAHHSRSREILERLHGERPDDFDATASLAHAWLHIGWVHRGMTHRIEAALAAYREGRRLYGQLARDNPAVVPFRIERDVLDYALGDQLSTAGRFAEAEAVLRPAIEDGERIIAADPLDLHLRARHADAEIALGKALRGLDRTVEALQPLSRGRDLLRALRQSDPDDLANLLNYARCLRFLGAAQDELGRRDEAIRTVSESVRILEESSEEDRRRAFLIVANLAVIYDDLAGLQREAGRLADAERTLLLVEDLGVKYNGRDGRQRLDPRWLAYGRIQLGLMWRDMGRTSAATQMLEKAEAAYQALAEPDVDSLGKLAAIDSALAELADPGTRREEYDRRAAESFRRAVAAAEGRDLAGLAAESRFARLRMRPDLQGLILDRMFPVNPFAP